MAMGTDLLALLKDSQRMRAEDAARPLVACPICGNRLEINERGERNCDVGHFRTDRTTVGGM